MAGSVVLVLVLTVLILVLILLLIKKTKVKKTSVTLLKVSQNDAYGIITDKADISMDHNMAYGTSAHLPSPSQPGATLTQNPVYITTPNIPVKTNQSYGTSAHLPSPSQPGATLTQNPAYITTPNIPVKTNQSYGGTTTTLLDSDQLYATPRGEEGQVKQDLDYDYI